MKTFVQRVGGDRVSVGVMVVPGQSPETYEPTPRQMAHVAESRIFFRVGVPFERSWIDTIEKANPGMVVSDLRKGLTLRAMAKDDHGHAEVQEPGAAPDPHVWTAPRNVVIMARHIRDQLIAVDPEGREEYSVNFAEFHRELTALDADLERILSDIKQRRFMVYHPAWGYFADAYGLEQVPIEVGGREPGPRTLARVIDEAERAGIHVIFVQSQFSERSARAVAAAIDGRVVAIDPLAPDYLANLRRVGDAFAEAMR